MEWIDVKDKLPDDGDEVIGAGYIADELYGRDENKSIALGIWEKGEIKLPSCYYSIYMIDIIKWMPAPKDE